MGVSTPMATHCPPFNISGNIWVVCLRHPPEFVPPLAEPMQWSGWQGGKHLNSAEYLLPRHNASCIHIDREEYFLTSRKYILVGKNSSWQDLFWNLCNCNLLILILSQSCSLLVSLLYFAISSSFNLTPTYFSPFSVLICLALHSSLFLTL